MESSYAFIVVIAISLKWEWSLFYTNLKIYLICFFRWLHMLLLGLEGSSFSLLLHKMKSIKQRYENVYPFFYFHGNDFFIFFLSLDYNMQGAKRSFIYSSGSVTISKIKWNRKGWGVSHLLIVEIEPIKFANCFLHFNGETGINRSIILMYYIVFMHQIDKC